ncbi:methionyl-tRNA formyltransferase [Candidatus Uhrbacteria bacterium]|nr:methionyl-tRNA formyltransferase [Candidatus Uhrbacteria bacterium]
MRLIFLGTPHFSTPFLSALLHDPFFEVAAVVCQPNKPSGRGEIMTMPPIAEMARKHEIELYQPATLKSEEAAAQMRSYNADAFVVVAYGKLIPKNILEIPKLGCINVHPSLLPKFRGPSPMQWAVKEGEVKTGVSIMLLDEGMDTGPILSYEVIGLDDDETSHTLQDKVQREGVALLVQTLKRHAADEIIPLPQDESKATLTRLLDREDGHIDWERSAIGIERQHRAYEGFPGSWNIWKRKGEDVRIKWIAMNIVDLKHEKPSGTVIVQGDRLFVEAADGTVEMTEVQMEGKKACPAAEFLKGNVDIAGSVLK